MSILAVIASYASLHFFLKLIYLLLKPGFLKSTVFGQEDSKGTKVVLYLTFIFYNIIFALHKFGIIKVNII
jgi:hypothetical protein